MSICIATRGRDDPGQALGAAGAGEQTELDLGDAEARALVDDAQVARERELEPAAERHAVDRGDARLREPLQAPQHGFESLDERAELDGSGEGGELLDVRTG